MNDLKSRASGALTRRMAAGVCALVVGLALVGCTTPDPVETPVTPTSTWSKADQQTIDAVQRYLDVWTEIGENVDTADWNRIYEVAGDPVAKGDIGFWTEWKAVGQHMVGGPVITVTAVNQGPLTSQGFRKYVYACFDASNSYLYTTDGSRVENRGLERQEAAFTVVDSGAGEPKVIELLMESVEC